MSVAMAPAAGEDQRPVSRVRRRLATVVGAAALAAGAVLVIGAPTGGDSAAVEAKAQASLRRDFRPPTTHPPRTRVTVVTTTSTTSTTVAPTPPPLGEPVAVLRIPKLGLDKVVVEGTDRPQLQLGPGHYTATPLPGQPGNIAIAGHRTTYGAPFRHLDDLQPGDELFLATMAGERRYVVEGARRVAPTDVSVLDPTGDDRVTLTTCDPPGSARYRLIVTAIADP
jgi:sortase A